jgi:hypothetical protein
MNRQIEVEMIVEAEVVPVSMATLPVSIGIDHSVPTEPSGLIRSLCANLKEMRKGRCLLLPIKKINNISVEVSITKEHKSNYVLNIGPTEFTVAEDSLYEVIFDNRIAGNIMEEDKFIDYVVNVSLANLKKLKIDKMNGCLTTTQPSPKFQKMDEMWAEFCQEFKDEENLELTINECCVCFTMTKTTTNCGHTVCLECIAKLKTDDVMDEHMMRNVKHISCPMCRQRVLFLL